MQTYFWTRRTRRGRLLMLLPLAILPGCGTTTASGGADVFCRATRPISWAIGDTDETIRQAKAHNAVGRALCGWRPTSR